MNDNFIFKTGKYSGKSYGLIKKIDPQYISWCEENAPGMLKEKKNKSEPQALAPRKEPPDDSEAVPRTTLKENTNFLNEKPDVFPKQE